MLVVVEVPKRDSDSVGITCPRCGCADLRVYYTRRKANGTIMRSRECRHCGRRVVTKERAIGQ